MPNLPQQCQFSPLPVHLNTPQGLVVVVVDDVVVMVIVEVVVEVVVIVVVVVPVYLEYQNALPLLHSFDLFCPLFSQTTMQTYLPPQSTSPAKVPPKGAVYLLAFDFLQ